MKDINRSTNYIIVGDFENIMIKGSKSSKLRRAEKMVEEGLNLEILSEKDFLKMI